MASPRLCWTELGDRETAEAVEGRTRADSEDTAFVEGACRGSIVTISCAQWSEMSKDEALEV